MGCFLKCVQDYTNTHFFTECIYCVVYTLYVMFAETLYVCQSVNQRSNRMIGDEPVGEETSTVSCHDQPVANTGTNVSQFCLKNTNCEFKGSAFIKKNKQTYIHIRQHISNYLPDFLFTVILGTLERVWSRLLITLGCYLSRRCLARLLDVNRVRGSKTSNYLVQV